MIEFKRLEAFRDYKQLATDTAKAVAEGAFLDFSDMASHAIDVIAGAFGTTKNPEEHQNAQGQAWQWMYSVLSVAATETLGNPHLRGLLNREELEPAIRELLETLPDQGTVPPDRLINPAINPHFDAAATRFPGIVHRITEEQRYSPVQLETMFRRALSDAAGKVLASRTADFEQLSTYLTSQLNGPAKRKIAWTRHANWVRKRFTQTPIFSPDETETIPLSHVYLRTRCYWHSEHDLPGGGDAEDRGHLRGIEDRKKYRRAHLRDLHDTMHAWLEADRDDDRIRVIAGGPGSGKSSFANAFATEVIDKGTHRVIFVPLQYLNLRGNLDEDIGTHLQSVRGSNALDTSMGFPENPLTWRADEDLPILIVFDGLDELSANEKTATDLSRRFILSLNNTLGRLNVPGTPPVNAVVLGRSTACQEALDEASLSLRTLLHVAPITGISRKMMELPDDPVEGRHDLDDPSGLQDNDTREAYWKHWCRVKRLDPDPVPEAITSATVGDLNAEPLLLHP